MFWRKNSWLRNDWERGVGKEGNIGEGLRNPITLSSDFGRLSGGPTGYGLNSAGLGCSAVLPLFPFSLPVVHNFRERQGFSSLRPNSVFHHRPISSKNTTRKSLLDCRTRNTDNNSEENNLYQETRVVEERKDSHLAIDHRDLTTICSAIHNPQRVTEAERAVFRGKWALFSLPFLTSQTLVNDWLLFGWFECFSKISLTKWHGTGLILIWPKKRIRAGGGGSKSSRDSCDRPSLSHFICRHSRRLNWIANRICKCRQSVGSIR